MTDIPDPPHPAEPPALVRRRLRVRGRVQGVWFRASTQQAADDAGATGWVRNLPDGDVEVEVQGSPAQVGAVEAFCRQGPPRARVAEVDAEDAEVVSDEVGFAVR